MMTLHPRWPDVLAIAAFAAIVGTTLTLLLGSWGWVAIGATGVVGGICALAMRAIERGGKGP